MPYELALVAFILLSVPGLLLAIALFPPRSLPVASAAGLVIPLGISAVALLSVILAVAHVLMIPWLVGGYIGLVLAGVAGSLRQGRWRAHLAAWREGVAAERLPLAIAGVTFAAFAVVRLTFVPVLNLADQTPLRYWADGLEVAGAHRVPKLTLQWGHLVPATVSKVALNAFDAAASLVLGRGPFGPMGALLVVVSLGLFLAAVALARTLGLRLTAPLVAVGLFANHLLGPRNLTNDLVNYRAEDVGRLLALTAAVLLISAVAPRDGEAEHPPRAFAVMAGVLFGVGAAMHLIPLLVLGLFAGLYAMAAATVGGRGMSILRPVATAGVIAVVLGAVIFVSSGGTLGFQGAANTAAYRGIAADLHLPASFDPTRYLALGQVHQPPLRHGFYDPPGVTYYEFVRRAVGEDRLRRPLLWLIPVAMALALVGLLVWGERRLRTTAAASAALAVAILGIAFAFNHHSHLYVLAEFGPRRLFDYTSVPAVLMAAAVGEVLLHRVGPRLRRIGDRAPVAAAVVVLLVAVVALPMAAAPSDLADRLPTALGPLGWIAANVPCDGRVLADRRTLATFETMTRHAGVVEGMGPYLRPAVLDDALRSLFLARTFFLQPRQGLAFLRLEHVAAVVATTYDQTLGGVGGPLRLVGRTPDLAGIPFLRVAVRSRTVTVYRVIGFRPAAGPSPFPDVRTLPGYSCR